VRKLIVNADDFGFTRDVNQGILQAHQQGILTATTLMANGPAFADAVRLAKENPTLDIGCHLVLVGDPPFPPTLAQLVPAVMLGRIRIYEELSVQVRRIQDAGLTPTHLDTHKHTHLLPQVLDAVARISQEFGIPWVRRPFDFPGQPGGVGWTSRLMQLGSGWSRTALARRANRPSRPASLSRWRNDEVTAGSLGRLGGSNGRAVFHRFRTVFHPFIDRFLRFSTVFTVFRKRLGSSQKCKAFPALDRLLTQ